MNDWRLRVLLCVVILLMTYYSKHKLPLGNLAVSKKTTTTTTTVRPGSCEPCEV